LVLPHLEVLHMLVLELESDFDSFTNNNGKSNIVAAISSYLDWWR
jgi:hypothetical protein